MHLPRVCSARWPLLLLLAGLASAQATLPRPVTLPRTLPHPSDADDPFTKDDAAARTRAGVVAVGRFPWADHTTVDIQSLMGFEPFRFLETAHFKIASSLAPLPLPEDRAVRKRLLGELDELRKKLPSVASAPEGVDAWLRVHLFAQRLEHLHATFTSTFGTARDDHQGKTLVLLCRSGASVGTYARNYLDLNPPRRTLRHRLVTGESLLAAAEHLPDEDLAEDARLHAAVAYHAARLLLERRAAGAVPLWLGEGVGHWFRERAVPEVAHFAEHPRELPETPHEPGWGANVRARATAGWQPPAAELFLATDPQLLRFVDHVEAWSRVDFLIRTEPPALPILLHMLRQSSEPLVARSAPALRAVLGWQLAEFDARWRHHVLANYPRE